MDKELFHINPPDVSATKDFSPGKNMVKYRWIMLMLVVPLFYIAATKYGEPFNFFKMFIGLFSYNIFVTLYLAKDHPRRGLVSKYIYYYDIIAISALVFMLGGLNSDIYVIYFFVILAFGAANSLVITMKLALSIMGFYSAACILFGELQNVRWIFGEGMIKLAIRNVCIMIVAYAIGLLIIEVKRAEHLHRIEYKKARTDKLTGLPNRHFLEQRLAEEIVDCEASGKVLNVLVFDLDNFKKFNDTYGHLWGDELLKRFAGILDQCIRKSDIAVRFGGEEFLLIIKDIDFVTAKSVGNRVRRQLEKEKIVLDDGVTQKRVSVSCGVAQYPTHSSNISEVIDFADQALYVAKENGKNMVVGYDEVLASKQCEHSGEKNIEMKAI